MVVCIKRLSFCGVLLVCTTLMCLTHSFIAREDSQDTKSNEKPKVNEALNIQQDDWIDPGDMLYDISGLERSGMEKRKGKEEKNVNAKQQQNGLPLAKEVKVKVGPTGKDHKNCEMPYFKQLTRSVLETVEQSSIIQLSKTHVQKLEDFRNGRDNDEAVYDVLDIISGIFNQLQGVEKESNTYWSHISLKINVHQETIAVSVIISVLAGIILILENYTTMSWSKQFWYVLSGMFIISIPWEWFRLYRQEFAKKQATVVKEGAAQHCFPSNMTVLHSLSLWMTNLVSWKEDECGKYQEAILVDPVWEISPSQAFSITVTRFFAKPLEYIAEAVGRSMNKLFIQLPVQWQPVMFIVLVLLFTLCLLLVTNSRVKLGFFEIGPLPVQARARLQNEDLKALEDRIALRLQNVLTTVRERKRPVESALPAMKKPRQIVAQEEAKEQEEESGSNIVLHETRTPEYDLPLKEVEERVQDLHLN